MSGYSWLARAGKIAEGSKIAEDLLNAMNSDSDRCVAFGGFPVPHLSLADAVVEFTRLEQIYA